MLEPSGRWFQEQVIIVCTDLPPKGSGDSSKGAKETTMPCAQDAGASVVDLARLQPYLDSGAATQPWKAWQPDQVFILANQTDVLRAILKDVDVVIDEARYMESKGVGG